MFVIQRKAENTINYPGKKLSYQRQNDTERRVCIIFLYVPFPLRTWAIMAHHNIHLYVVINIFCISVISSKLCSVTTKYRRCFALSL